MVIKNSIPLNTASLLIILLMSFSISAYANNKTNLLYDGYTARYEVFKDNVYLGVSERQLIKLSDNKYKLTSFTYAKGIVRWFVKDEITETSYYQIQKDTVIPSRYDYKNSNGKPRDNFSIIFGNNKNTVTRTKDNIKLDIANNKQDLLSFQAAIMLAMQKSQREMKFTIADNKRISEYSLKYVKDEILKTNKGDIKTQVMKSNSIRNKYQFIFWCAKKYNYFPVQVKRIKKNGDSLILKINRINGQKIIFDEPDDDDDF